MAATHPNYGKYELEVSPYERVASMLLMLLRRMAPADCHADRPPAPTELELPLSRAEIAQFLGLTIETVSRMLKRLSTAGIIAVGSGRMVRIISPEDLEMRAAGRED